MQRAHRMLFGLLMASMIGGCAVNPPPVTPEAPAPEVVAAAPEHPDVPVNNDGPSRRNGPWIGAAGASDFVLAGTTDTVMGVWVDVPTAQRGRAPASVALVIDTSGSMAGVKIEKTRLAAQKLVDKLSNGDAVMVASFSDEARELIPPTILSASTRPVIARAIAGLRADGSTNMFDGLRLGESRVVLNASTHPVRRVVVISDGQANVGPSSPEILGQVAARGTDNGVQVTALGVGLDYDERTLNALAVRSSGRMFHIDDPQEMVSILDKEVALLQSTAATDAVVEIVPAPGVQILGAEGAVRADWSGNGAIRVPLGTMFGGQHREMLVRVRVTSQTEGDKPLASVRLKFRDPAEGNLERIQEVVARCQVTNDRVLVEQRANDKTKGIQATIEASNAALAAAQLANTGQFEAADRDLAVAEEKLRAAASIAKNKEDKQRALANASKIATVRSHAKAAAVAPPAAKPSAGRASGLKINRAAMDAYGY